MMTYNHNAYFENIARKLKLLNHTNSNRHYFRASSVNELQELIATLTTAHYPALIIIDKLDGKLTDHDSSNLIDVQFYQVLILNPVDGQSSESRIYSTELCRRIFISILSKMTLDKLTDSRLPVGQELSGLRNLNRDEILYSTVGPILDNLYGVEFTFTISVRLDTSFVAENWHE